MDEKYLKELLNGYATNDNKWSDYIIDSIYKKESKYSDSYNDWGNLINIYYDSKLFVEETDKQKSMRLAKEKAEKRNSNIDKILGD